MKHTKWLVLMGLMLALMLTLCACGQNGSENANESSTNSDGLEFLLNEDEQTYSVRITDMTKTEIVIPDTYQEKPVTHFFGCTTIRDYYYEIGLTGAPGENLITVSVLNVALTKITIPASIIDIHPRSLDWCTALENITVDKNNEYYCSIDGNLYSKDGKMLLKYAVAKKATEFQIPASVTQIANGAFAYSTTLKNVTIPSGVTEIGNSAFYNCTHLSSITIPDSVTSIDYSAFYGCTSLSSIAIPDSVTSIGDSAFYGCTSLSSIAIPDSVTSIGNSAFYGCKSLTGITIPVSVTNIGDSAFRSCTNLTSVTIPDSVTSINDYAFYNCTNLTSITVGENNVNYKSIDGNLYTKDGTVLIQYAIGKSATSFMIPDSVTSIGVSAFSWCTSLTSITIPDSITSIGWYAFSDCTSLKAVYYGGTASDWSAISIDSSNTYLTNATRYYYSETKPTDTTYQYWHYDENGNPVAW